MRGQRATPASDTQAGQLSYDIDLSSGQSWTMVLTCTAAQAEGDQFPAPPTQVPWSMPVLTSADRRLDRRLQQSLADLDRLR
ncbi:hypothetical protein [Streptomyces sp. BRA346]|uniref:hypothetical protein n=1 Tax=Streptomyces sp. BRA346 TaxID=2878199 RepID=UPI0040649A56